MSSNQPNSSNQPPLQDGIGGSSFMTTSTPQKPIARQRSLRGRPSVPDQSPSAIAGPSTQPITSPRTPASTAMVGYREPTAKELAQISRRLGYDNIRAKREEILAEKEKQLRDVLEGHDDAIREQFHLERFVTMITGWDPRAAKVDNSPVFLEWKDQRHNLLSLLPPSASISTPAQAGPSRPRTSAPARTTRRQAHEQSDILGFIATPTSAPVPVHTPASDHPTLAKSGNKTIDAQSEATPLSAKSRGKRRASEIITDDVEAVIETATPPVKGKPGRKPKTPINTPEMPPPPVPAKRGRPARRATMDEQTVETVENVEVKEEEFQAENVKGKKRGRMSLPNLPAAKKTRGSQTPIEETEPVPSPIVETPREPSPIPSTPIALPSLSHLPFPPPPKRPISRINGPKKILYTDPSQKPPASSKYDGHISPILESYIHIEDSGPILDLKTLEARAAKDGYYRARVMYLQSHGRLQRLLDEAEPANQNDPTLSRNTILANKSSSNKLPSRKTDFQDSLMSHMVQVRNAMLNEAKMKPIVCKRIARMIQVYWERIEGREERERLAEEKEKKRLGKELIKGLRKRWSLAVKIIRAKLLEIQKVEQDRLGKEHLQNILQRSTGLLEAQVAGPEEEEDEDSEDDVSDATEDVSAAEESDEDGEDELEGEEEGSVNEEDEDDLDTGDQVEENDTILATSSSPPVDVNAAEIQGNEVNEEDQGEVDNSVADNEDQANLAFLVSEDPVNGHDVNMNSDGVEQDSIQTGPEDSKDTVNGHSPLAKSEGPSDLQITPKKTILTANGLHPVSVSSPDPLDLIDVSTSSPDPLDTLPKLSRTPSSTSKLHLNGHEPKASSSPSFTPISRSRRARKIKPPASLLMKEDPDVDDVDFTAAPTSEVDEQDVELDVEMEEEDEDQARDSEDEGLLKDADIPIEELLKRYGYPAPEQDEHAQEEKEPPVAETVVGEDAPMEIDVAIDPNGEHQPNGSTPAESAALDLQTMNEVQTTKQIATDKSLLDDRLPEVPVSPQLIVEGKRQRRIRSVWSPDAETPQHLSSARRPKIEVVEETKESSPEPMSEEESEEESEDDDEEEAAHEDGEDGEKLDNEEKEGPRVRQPFLLRGTLRPYQQGGLEWLASLWENGMNGILADEMGLGKTIQTIALLGHLACDKGIWGQHLIIVPTSVILNWEMEFKKFFPGMKVLTYYGNQKERKEKRVGWLTENKWQVCITSYQIVLADQHIFRRKSWCYMILDEAHNIKNFRSQRWQTLLGFKASRRLLLTGTPLQNNLMELWSLLYFLMPGGIGADATAVVGFANHKEFMEWFSNPMDKAIETGDAMDEETLATVSKLHTLLRPFILRRLKSEVETQLPGKFEHVVYCKLSKRQRFLYDEFMSRSSTKEALTSGGYLGVMNTLMQLRKVCNHPDLFEVRPVRTSFAMDNVARGFEPKDILIRRRLLGQDDDPKLDVMKLGLGVTSHEQESGWVCRSRQTFDASDKLPHAIEPIIVRRGKPPAGPKKDTRTVEGWLQYQSWAKEQASILRWRSLRDVNRRRCSPTPIYGSTFLNMLTHTPNYLLPLTSIPKANDLFAEYRPPASSLVLSLPTRAKTLEPIIDLFAVIPPNVVARDMPKYALPGLTPSSYPSLLEESFDTLHQSTVKLQIAFPDSSLLQYDCGKLQTLYTMLRDLKAGGHRVLIFTQMTRVLDILEIFLSYNGHRYLRLDGSTKIEDRQIITERFNSDPKYFVFIASSRSGGVGINLTGADTVFFYDSDWNPSMDRQCMDRAHRIGQTREVHIYRFISSHTIEENMLKKSNQKRLLDNMVIQQGQFNNDWWGRVGWKDMFGDVTEGDSAINGGEGISSGMKSGRRGGEEDEGMVIDVDVENTPVAEEIQKLKPRVGEERELARVLAQVEDEEDVQAAKIAQNENELDFQEFDEVPGTTNNNSTTATKGDPKKGNNKVSFDIDIQSSGGTPLTINTPRLEDDTRGEAQEVGYGDEEEEEDDDDGIGGIDEYMLKWVEEDWSWFINFRA